MSDSPTPFIRFTYTILNPDGIPQQKSWIINTSYIISVEADASDDLKFYLTNNQVITISPGQELDTSQLMNDILNLSANGMEFCVYKIDAFEKN